MTTELETRTKENTAMTLDQRFEKLECKCRQLKRVLIGMMTAVVALVVVAAAPKPGREPVQTEKLEIVDADGNVRIRLGPADEGVGLVVYDKAGRFQATFTGAPQGAVMQLSQDGGSINLMAMGEASGITIRDQNGKPRALMLHYNRAAEIMLKDKEGNAVFSAPK